jgi:hypothetical protein
MTEPDPKTALPAEHARGKEDDGDKGFSHLGLQRRRHARGNRFRPEDRRAAQIVALHAAIACLGTYTLY